MKFILDEEHKFAEFWMTNADQTDPEVEAEVQRQIREWHAKGYLPVIYRSGKEDLTELTSALLLSNRNRMARREAAAERAAEKESGERVPILEQLCRKPPQTSKPHKSRQHDMSR